ncbi:MAG TPA: molybdopterin biosynthesis protein, partial [Dehalococcoidales bacterium]|nr:molybdopterin biosynthesis protein [Dehalococcoidales bacterium]
TGNAMPPGTNAVIMVEDIQVYGEEAEIQAAVPPWQHVRLFGEDIVATELVLPVNHLIQPHDLGAMTAAGVTEIEVRRKPRVAVIPTGSELVTPDAIPTAGKIIEFNSLVLSELIREWGAETQRHAIVPDDKQLLLKAVSGALAENDIVVINAGSSAGSRDYTSTIVEELGKVIVHGIAIKPGHPTILGIAQNKAVIGIPGYPVSALITTELVVKPLVYKLQGMVPPALPRARAVVNRKMPTPLGQDEFVRVTLGRIGDRLVATPLSRGAGVIMSLVRADGLLRIPRFSQGLESGDTAEIELRRPLEEIENTIVAIGSHDLSLDILNSLLHQHYPGKRLSSAHVGSLGGLIALKRKEAHIAGTHLLDENTGEYNFSYIKQYIPGEKTVLMNLVYRQQGLMVMKRNPKHITCLADLLRSEVSFVNRQRGSGTRVLLDYKLKEAGLDAGKITGYNREEFSHTAVAAIVSSGAADVGLGVFAAAKALGLDFIPLLKERYDLAIPLGFYESPLLQPLLAIIRGEEFQKLIASLGGYDISETGKVLGTIG